MLRSLPALPTVPPWGRFVLWGAFAVAVSVLAFAYSSNFGQILILAYYAVWLPLALVVIPLEGSKRCGKLQFLAGIALLLLVSMLFACSGAKSDNNSSQTDSPAPAGPSAFSATPTGTYNVLIHAVSGSLESSTSVQLGVE